MNRCPDCGDETKEDCRQCGEPVCLRHELNLSEVAGVYIPGCVLCARETGRAVSECYWCCRYFYGDDVRVCPECVHKGIPPANFFLAEVAV